MGTNQYSDNHSVHAQLLGMISLKRFLVTFRDEAIMISDSDYNMVYNNHAKGDGYSNVFVSGGHSLADNNVL